MITRKFTFVINPTLPEYKQHSIEVLTKLSGFLTRENWRRQGFATNAAMQTVHARHPHAVYFPLLEAGIRCDDRYDDWDCDDQWYWLLAEAVEDVTRTPFLSLTTYNVHPFRTFSDIAVIVKRALQFAHELEIAEYGPIDVCYRPGEISVLRTAPKGMT